MPERKFERGFNEYGAYMGRGEYGDLKNARRVRLFRVRLDAGGYDNGGAYWGHGYNPLWCALAPDTSKELHHKPTDARAFVRAASRKEAAELLGLKSEQLIRGV